jgi:hypothetical protein
MNTGAICASGINIVDNVLGQDPAVKSGYTTAYAPGAAVGGVVNTYTLSASPLKVGTTGQRGFFSDQTGVIRYNQTGTAIATDPALQ